MDELLGLANAHGCKFSTDFKQKTMDEMSRPSAFESIMWQDFVAKRPMEVETFLGSPIKLAQELNLPVPRIETLYAILYNLNITNRQKPRIVDAAASLPPASPTAPSPLPRNMSQTGPPRPMMNGMPNGNMRGPRPRTSSNLSGPAMRRPAPPGGANGYGRPPMNGGSRQQSRRGSMEGDLEEFSYLVVHDDIPEGGEAYQPDGSDLALRERELQLKQRELALREQELRMNRPSMGGPPPMGTGRGPPNGHSNGHHNGMGMRRGPHPMRNSAQVLDDEDDDEDYFDPTGGSQTPMIDPDNFDMMSVTSRKNRKMPSHSQIRKNPEFDGAPPSRGGRFRPNFGRNRSSQVVGGSVPTNSSDNFLDDPLMSCVSNRYGNVDRSTMHAESRTNSLTSAKLDEMQYGGPPMMNGAMPRRTSQSPGNPYSPSVRTVSGRPSPPNGFQPGPSSNRRPSPPDGMRQPIPRYPPGHGNSVAPHQVEQHIGVSPLVPPKQKNVRSLTGSASASAGSGDTQIDSEPSAHSSQSSLQHRPPIGVR